MKQFILLACLFSWMLMTNTAFSQKKNRASMEIILSDHSDLKVLINDREFKEVNQKLYVNDIPSGKIYLEVVKVCPNGTDDFCNQRVFYGYIELEKNKHYQAVVLVGEQEIIVSDKNNLFDNASENTTDLTNQKLASEYVLEYKATLPYFWENIYKELKATEIDADKKQLLIEKINKEPIDCAVLMPLLSTFVFDDSKSQCLQEIYPFIADKENLSLLKYAFTLESNFTEALKHLK